MSKHWKSAETLKMLLLQTVFFFLAISDGFQLTWWIWIYLLLVFNGQQILYGFLSVSPAQFNCNLSVWALSKVCLGVLVTQPIQMQTSEGIQQKNLTMRQLPVPTKHNQELEDEEARMNIKTGCTVARIFYTFPFSTFGSFCRCTEHGMLLFLTAALF